MDLKVWEHADSWIHIMKYSEERAAQRANSERLNLVLAYLTDEDMHVRKRYKAEGKKKNICED